LQPFFLFGLIKAPGTSEQLNAWSFCVFIGNG